MDDFGFLQNATASFDDLVQNGAPSAPLPYDDPIVGMAERHSAPVLNPATGEARVFDDIIFDIMNPERAYIMTRLIKNCNHGVVRHCFVLRARGQRDVPWEVTSEHAAVKIISWDLWDHRSAENPLHESTALQLLANDGEGAQVLRLIEVLQNDEYLFIFMPLFQHGSLLDNISSRAGQQLDEPTARCCFRQILQGISHLHRKGICHRDISAGNILVHSVSGCVVIDLGMSLLIPYDNGDGDGGITDVSAGTLRRLFCRLHPCGKYHYMAPEILSSTDPFDGFAIDIWAIGVVLFVMLVGFPPWEMPNSLDERFRLIVNGGLKALLNYYGRPVSPLAVDLLQRIFCENPAQRLNHADVNNHEWMLGPETPLIQAEDDAEQPWRH